MTTLGTAFNPKHNAIGFIRLFLAIAVVFSHSFNLGLGVGDPVQKFNNTTIGAISVDSFFFLSGYLITCSYLNSADAYIDFSFCLL